MAAPFRVGILNDMSEGPPGPGRNIEEWLPAAEGYDGTTLGFGHYDRGALHDRYLVLRQRRSRVSVEVPAQ